MVVKFNNINPTTGLLAGITALVMSSCGTYTTALQSAPQQELAAADSQSMFIEDFWTDTTSTVITPRL